MRSVRASAGVRGQSAELDQLDAFVVIRDRFFGLRCAIGGASIANADDRQGLLQLADDLASELDGFCNSLRERRRTISARRQQI